MLNEISVAKLCLLRPERKAQYDQQLRARLAVAGSATARPSEAQPLAGVAAPLGPTAVLQKAAWLASAEAPAESPAWQADAMDFSQSSIRRGTAVRRKKSGAPALLMVGGPIAVLAALGAIAFALSNRANESAPGDATDAGAVAVAPPQSHARVEPHPTGTFGGLGGKSTGPAKLASLGNKSPALGGKNSNASGSQPASGTRTALRMVAARLAPPEPTQPLSRRARRAIPKSARRILPGGRSCKFPATSGR